MSNGNENRRDEDSAAMFLDGLNPRGPNPEIRELVLSAIDRELAGSPAFRSNIRRIEHVAWRSLAAGLLFGILANGLVFKLDGNRRARLAGPTVIPTAVAAVLADFEGATGRPADENLRRELVAKYRNRSKSYDMDQIVFFPFDPFPSPSKESGT